jgi:stage V sporulation protein B
VSSIPRDPTHAAADLSSAKAQAEGRAGRGVLSITSAKIYFIVTGYAVQLLLPRLLGSPEAFGLYASAMNVVSILNNVLIAATVQTVSKHVSAELAHADTTLRQGLLLQAGVGLTLGGALWALSPVLASRVLLDPLLAPLIGAASIVVFCYAPYAALIGSLNGRQQFTRQAALDVTYSTLRTFTILGAAALGFGALGAIVGFVMATVLVLGLALLVVGTGAGGRRIAWKHWLLFMAPLWLYQLALNLTMQVDLSVLKGTVAALSRNAGMTAIAAAAAASRLAGFYRAAQTFAFVPYQLILSITFVIFPMISQAVSEGDHAASQRYIRGAMRFSLLVLLAVAAPISGAASGVMRLAYPDVYLGGAEALAILPLGMVCFALFVVGSTILSGAGRPGLPAAIAVVTVVLVLGCDVGLIRAVGVGDHTLLAAAAGTTLGTTFALLAVAAAVNQRFDAFIAPLTAIRALGSAAIGWAVAHALPSHSAVLALGALTAGGIAFVVALIASRELGPGDYAALRRLAPGRR